MKMMMIKITKEKIFTITKEAKIIITREIKMMMISISIARKENTDI